MHKIAYKKGFKDAILGLKKEAQKLLAQMTPEEQQKATAASQALKKIKKTEMERYARDKVEDPQTFREVAKDIKNRFSLHAKSLGRATAAALGVTALRGANTAFNFATYIPAAADKLIFGKMLGVGNGQGLMGRNLANLDRYVDSKVNKLRRWSSDYDYKHRINGSFNRFLTGTAADVVGNFGGAGGVGAILGARGALGKALGLTFGGAHGLMALSDGRERQLREREAEIRRLHPKFWDSMDATSTIYHQQAAPTHDEIRRYYTPSILNLPTSATGRIKIPKNWAYTEDGTRTQFRPFGT